MAATPEGAAPVESPLVHHWHGLVRHPRHGPLPGLLLVLTVTSGVIDAVSILSLGRVFVANMTGNVLFVGFALARTPGFSLSASLFALGGFILGAVGGGTRALGREHNRARLLRDLVAVELALVAAALAIAIGVGSPIVEPATSGVALLLAIALGSQNAIVRHLAVPDLTTTVVTMTLTGLASEATDSSVTVILRRVSAVATMLLGGVVGALLVLHVGPSAALGLALGLLCCVGLGVLVAGRASAPWQHAT